MKTTVRLPISKSDKILVGEGDTVTSNTPILERHNSTTSKIVQVSQLLKVKEKSIYKYLKNNLGDQVLAGEILVEKKGFWSTVSLKSPLTGKIDEVDLTKGTLTITSSDPKTSNKWKMPVPGKISRITPGFIEVEVNASCITGEKGEGSDVLGKIAYFPGETVNIFEINSNVENEIVLLNKISDEIMVKLEVLGACGIVTVKPSVDMTLPWVRVDEDKITKLVHYKESRVWLRPEEKQIIIVE